MPIHLTALVLMGVLMLLTGILGVWYACLLRLNVAGYTSSLFVMFWGGLWTTVAAILISQGVTLVGKINWPTFVMIWGGLTVTIPMFLANLVGLRNARRQTKEQREEFAKMKRALSDWHSTKRELING